MAGADAERHDGKLESFLSRNLPRGDYERLVTKQPCVAVVEGEKPAHRHAIVGHRRLYLTEVPPRSVRVAVELQDVESIQMSNKPADFLQGKEKDEAVHVQIHHTREARQDSRSLLGSLGDLSPAVLRRLSSGAGNRKTERKSLPSPLLKRNNTTPQSGSGSLLTASDIHKSSSAQSLELLGRQEKSQSLSPVVAAKVAHSDPKRTSIHSPPSFCITSSSPVISSKKSRKQSPSPSSFTSDLASPHGARKRSSLEKPFKMSPHAATFQKSPDKSRDSSIAVLQTPNTSHLSTGDTSTSDPLHSSKSSPNLLIDSSIIQPFSTLSPLDSSSSGSSRRKPHHSSTHSLHESSERDQRKVRLDQSAERIGTEREVLNLYILKQKTDFYHHLCAAWHDLKIAITLETPNTSQSNGKSPGTTGRDHFSHHFHTLKQELVSATTVPESARLIHELCTACQKYFVIKRLFWEDHALLEFLIAKLQYSSDGGKKMLTHDRVASEIEYRLMVLDLLYQMLTETHALQRRCLSLTRNSGNCLRQLSSAVIHLLPSLSKEDSSFEDELVEKSSGILSESFQLAQQMRWPCAGGGVVSPEWLTAVLAKQPYITDFCRALITRVSSILHLDHLEPHDTVALHHIAHVLSCLALPSGPLLDLMRTHFSEEFRYFISVSTARQKLPVNSPLTSDTLSLLQHTKSKVLKS